MSKDFARDLGYLSKFLQGLRTHAASLEAPASARLAALLDDQERAWAEIRSLIAAGTVDPGAAPVEASRLAPEAPRPAPETPLKPAAPSVATTGEATGRRFTVGSLIS
jgi:hypothetical protein